MLEYVKHLLGLCGEPHGLIFTLKTLFTIGGLSVIAHYIRTKTNK